MDFREDRCDDYEPDSEEIEAMLAMELDHAWEEYGDDVGEGWLASQEGSVASQARTLILALTRRRVQEQQSAAVGSRFSRSRRGRAPREALAVRTESDGDEVLRRPGRDRTDLLRPILDAAR